MLRDLVVKSPPAAETEHPRRRAMIEYRVLDNFALRPQAVTVEAGTTARPMTETIVVPASTDDDGKP